MEKQVRAEAVKGGEEVYAKHTLSITCTTPFAITMSSVTIDASPLIKMLPSSVVLMLTSTPSTVLNSAPLIKKGE